MKENELTTTNFEAGGGGVESVGSAGGDGERATRPCLVSKNIRKPRKMKDNGYSP
jgi:hypothetical protein